LNGKPTPVSMQGGAVLFGNVPTTGQNEPEEVLPELPFSLGPNPGVVRSGARDRRDVTFSLTNTLDEAVSGSLQFELPKGLAVEPKNIVFGPLQPKRSESIRVTILSNEPSPGRHTLPYRISYRRNNNAKEIRTAALPLTIVNGPTLQSVYEHPRP